MDDFDSIVVAQHAEMMAHWVERNLIGDMRDFGREYAEMFAQVITERDEARRELNQSYRDSISHSETMMATILQHTLAGDIEWHPHKEEA